jgi:hypothetical protein
VLVNIILVLAHLLRLVIATMIAPYIDRGVSLNKRK